MTSWGYLLLGQLVETTASNRLRSLKSRAPEEATTLGDDFEHDDWADRPAPAGGLVPPTLVTGLPGVGPALGVNADWVDWLEPVAKTPDMNTLPEFRRTVSEFVQRRGNQPLTADQLSNLLSLLLQLTSTQLEAQQRKQQRDAKKREAESDGQDSAWLNPLAHHRFGQPLATARSDGTASSEGEIANLHGTLKAAQALHQLRAVFYANLLCAHLAVRADLRSGNTPTLVSLLMRTATRLLQTITILTSDDNLGDNAAAIASELSRQLAAGQGFPAIGQTQRAAVLAAGLPRPFRPRWFGSPDSLLLAARHALDAQHHAWLEATAWLARDTAHLITCGLLAPRLQLLDSDDSLLLDELYKHLDTQKEMLRKAKRLELDATDPYQQVLAKPMYLHRVWEHLGFLRRARHTLHTTALRLPPSPLTEDPTQPQA